MGQLIYDPLAFSRLGKQAMSVSVLNMEQLLKEVWSEQCNINLSRRMELKNGRMPEALGDRSLVRQVFANLLSNAVKFTRNNETAVIEVGGAINGNEAIYSVKDNGEGFDMQYYDKLFGVFQRLHHESEIRRHWGRPGDRSAHNSSAWRSGLGRR